MFNRNEIGSDTAPTRTHRPWYELEEYSPDGGMWVTPSVSDRDRFITKSAAIMTNPKAFTAAMRQALAEWPRSVAAAMTTPGLNHRAWIGHAGCYLATGSPEEATRLGWHQLSDREQRTANQAAELVIREWREAEARAVAVAQPDLFGEA